MGEPAARQRLREEREKAKAERAEATYEVRLTHRSLPDRATHLADELRKAFADSTTIPSAARFQAAAVMVGLQMLAGDLAIYERRVREEVAADLSAATARAETAEAAYHRLDSAQAAHGSYAGRAEAAEAELRRERAFDTRMFRQILEALDEDERGGWNGDALSRLICDMRGDICDRLAERDADDVPHDASGWTAAENAEFDRLYGTEAAMRYRAQLDRVWHIVQDLRDEAVQAGLDPYQDPMAQRLSAALVGAANDTTGSPE